MRLPENGFLKLWYKGLDAGRGNSVAESAPDGKQRGQARALLPGETMTKKDDSYRAYLLRCWREQDATFGECPQWRFSVEEVLHERRRKGFASLEALLAFLRAELAGGEGELSGKS